MLVGTLARNCIQRGRQCHDVVAYLPCLNHAAFLEPCALHVLASFGCIKVKIDHLGEAVSLSNASTCDALSSWPVRKSTQMLPQPALIVNSPTVAS
jgi:hypothetical protein